MNHGFQVVAFIGLIPFNRKARQLYMATTVVTIKSPRRFTMPDAIMYQEEDMFVVLMPGEEEVFMTPDELLAKLKDILSEHQDDLPRELQRFKSLEDQARHLRDTSCDFDLRPGEAMQWYVVRLEK
jgi:hypothetical protein